MAIYYVDPVNGSPANNGLSADAPLKTNVGLNVQPGDTVLFKRGSLIRGALHNVNGEEGRPVTYGAYGEGANPVFSGSVDVSAPECWQKYEGMDNVWRCVGALDACVGNFVFDQKEGGAFRWEKGELSEQGDWYDSAADKIETEMSAQEHEVRMYSAGNPGEVYDHIECAQCKHRALAKTGHDLIIENLTFQNNGLHGIATGVHNKNMIVRGCRFEFISKSASATRSSSGRLPKTYWSSAACFTTYTTRRSRIRGRARSATARAIWRLGITYSCAAAWPRMNSATSSR